METETAVIIDVLNCLTHQNQGERQNRKEETFET